MPWLVHGSRICFLPTTLWSARQTTALSAAATNYASVPLSTTAYFYGQYVWQPYATQTAPLLMNPVSLNNPNIQRPNNGPPTHTYGHVPGGNGAATHAFVLLPAGLNH